MAATPTRLLIKEFLTFGGSAGVLWCKEPQVKPIGTDLMTFSCAGCGERLTVPQSQAGISGPCPCCGTQITAPNEPQRLAPQPRMKAALAPAPAEVQVQGTAPDLVESPTAAIATDSIVDPLVERRRLRRSRGNGVAPDNHVNFAHEEQRDSAIVARIFIMAVAVALFCALVYYLQTRSL